MRPMDYLYLMYFVPVLYVGLVSDIVTIWRYLWKL